MNKNFDHKKNILITNALPYANGELHIGHMLGYIQSDIWKRFTKMLGHKCVHICGTDAHGIAVMTQAENLGINCEDLVCNMTKRHLCSLNQFDVEFDFYASTNNEYHANFVKNFYQKLVEMNLVYRKTIRQAFDKEKKTFLADRFIKGTCPFCKSLDQYGDVCESCGKVYTPDLIIDPYSVLSGSKPIFKLSEHYFFNINRLKEMIFENMNFIQDSEKKYLENLYAEGLHDWCISRDAPYYGIRIPNTTNKYFYVWFDAPLAYLSFTENLCLRDGLDFSDFWGKNTTYELYQYIGKDIVYFHAIYLVALLLAHNNRLPTELRINGFLTLKDKKMSKSRNSIISCSEFCQKADPSTFRYFTASTTKENVDDINFNWNSFADKVNSGLIDKVINLASRTSKILKLYFKNTLCNHYDNLPDFTDIERQIMERLQKCQEAYSMCQFWKVINEVESICDLGNSLFTRYTPWKSDYITNNQTHQACSLSLNCFKVAICILEPIIPSVSKKAKEILNISSSNDWYTISELLKNHVINDFYHLGAHIPLQEQEVDT